MQRRAGPQRAVARGDAKHDGARAGQRAERDPVQLGLAVADSVVKDTCPHVQRALNLHPVVVLDAEPPAVREGQQPALGPVPVKDARGLDLARGGGVFHDGGTRHADPPVPDFERGRICRLLFGVDPRDVQVPARVTPRLRDSSLGHAGGHSSRCAGGPFPARCEGACRRMQADAGGGPDSGPLSPPLAPRRPQVGNLATARRSVVRSGWNVSLLGRSVP